VTARVQKVSVPHLDYLASGMTMDQILGDFPDLTEEDLRACLAFAADRERRLAVIP
jgi:uncharacterized protein (DUF433 family)